MGSFFPVLILAGGLGTRISSIYPDTPKALIPINGKPFIEHQLHLLAREGVTEVILCVEHLSKKIETYLTNAEPLGIDITYSYDGEKLLGTGGAILKACQNLRGPFAILYGDSYLDTDFSPIKRAFLDAEKPGLMTVFKNNNQWDKSNILYKEGQILKYKKGQGNSKLEYEYIDYGLTIFDHKALDHFIDRKFFDLSDVFVDLITNKQLSAYEVKDRFYEIGSPSGLQTLTAHLSDKQSKDSI